MTDDNVTKLPTPATYWADQIRADLRRRRAESETETEESDRD